MIPRTVGIIVSSTLSLKMLGTALGQTGKFDPVTMEPMTEPAQSLASDLSVWFVVAFVLASFAFGYGLYKRRMAQLHQEEQLAALEFEARTLAGLRSEGITEEFSMIASDGGTPMLVIEKPQLLARPDISLNAVIPPPVPSTPLQQSSDFTPPHLEALAGWVLESLRQTSILIDIEGTEPRHGNPHGLLSLKLRKNRTAALLTEIEASSAFHHLLRRFDMVIIVSPGKKALVIQTFQQHITDQM